jgi:hypothetical protein
MKNATSLCIRGGSLLARDSASVTMRTASCSPAPKTMRSRGG